MPQISRRVYGNLHHLKLHTFHLPPSTKLQLIKSLVLPVHDYDCLVYYNLSGYLGKKLDNLLNASMRYVYNINRFSHITPYRIQANMLTPKAPNSEENAY